MAATAASTSEPRLDGVAGRLEPEAAGARLSELFSRHASTVVGVCRGMLRHREEAEDAAQQTFLAAYKALLGGTEPREPAAWLATIARNECRRRIADRMRAGVPIGSVEETLAGHASPISPADVSALREAIAGLPPMQQRAILLREFVGLSYDEVAQELAVTEPAVESLLFRARRTLQARLRPALGAAFGVGPIPALREALAQMVPGFTAASSGGGIAALASLPAAAKLAAGVATIGLVAGGTVVAVEKVEQGPRQPKTPAVLPLAGADVAAAAPAARVTALSVAAASAPDSRRGRLGAGPARHGEPARRVRVQPLVTSTAASAGPRAPVEPSVSGASDAPTAPKESTEPAAPVSSGEPTASAPVPPAPVATEQPTSSTPPKEDTGQSAPSGGTAGDDDSGPGGGGSGEDEDHSGPGGGDDGEDDSGPGGGGETDDDTSGGFGTSSDSSGSSSGPGSGEEPDDDSGGTSGSDSSGSGESDSGSSDSSGSGSGSGSDEGGGD